MIITNLDFLKNDIERAEYLKDILIERATGGKADEGAYQYLREYFLHNSECNDLLPDFVRTKTNLSQFWNFIKQKYSTYADRQNFISKEFSNLLNHLGEGNKNSISESLSDKSLSQFGTRTIHQKIQKGLERVKTDPEGAITLARTILESTCKFIADEKNIEYDDNLSLPKLYKSVAKELNLGPDQHNEKEFKKILGGCSSIIDGLGILRNKLGDAHGRSSEKVKPVPRHAELAVNIAGAMALFLIETHKS